MQVNNLKIPTHLEDLIQKSIWSKFKCNDLLKAIVNADYPEEYEFMDIANMQGIVDELKKLYNSGYGDVYGLTLNTPEKGRIELDKVVIIISNSEEEAICLDYSKSLRNPRVLASYFKDGKYVVWEEIASSFDDFMNKTKLNLQIS